jgi:hypothetical protein
MSTSNGERIATVDAFLDVDTARAAINQALKVVFEQDHIVAMWWSAENPRLGGRTPESLWNANPIKDPTARDAVYEVASTTAIWRAPTVQEHAAPLRRQTRSCRYDWYVCYKNPARLPPCLLGS